MMHGYEKSDPAIVAGKSENKDRQPSAKPMEPTAQDSKFEEWIGSVARFARSSSRFMRFRTGGRVVPFLVDPCSPSIATNTDGDRRGTLGGDSGRQAKWSGTGSRRLQTGAAPWLTIPVAP